MLVGIASLLRHGGQREVETVTVNFIPLQTVIGRQREQVVTDKYRVEFQGLPSEGGASRKVASVSSTD